MIIGKQRALLVAALIPFTLLSAELARAGSLEPDAPPGPTTQIPPAWSQKIAGAERFKLVLDGTGVLDKETGLVWEQSPHTSTSNWDSAFYYCNQILDKGDRKGWHLPTVEQLASLVDTSQTNPAFPSGHPFSNIQYGLAFYWTSSTVPYVSIDAWSVSFRDGEVAHNSKTGTKHVWCVRGGEGAHSSHG